MCIVPALIMAQEYSHEFGKVSKEELELKRYEKDTTAEAVVIYDIGKSYFLTSNNGFDLYFERKTRVKIFSKAGFKWAQIKIPYYEENFRAEEIIDLKGKTYNLNNGEVAIVELDPAKTFNEKNNEHWYNKKIAMPGIKEGSVFEISYKIKTPFDFNFRTWYFQSQIPVIHSEYTTKMIPFYEYCSVLHADKKYDEYKSYEEKEPVHHIGDINYTDMVYFYLMKDVPAFKDESFITSSDDYSIKLDFQLAAEYDLDGRKFEILSTWSKLANELTDPNVIQFSGKFGGYINDCKRKSKQYIETLNINSAANSAIEKAKKIDRFVKSNFSWNKNQYGLFATKSAKDFLKEKSGNSAEINLFMTGMLREAGVDAYPVLLSTRDHGKISANYPFLSYFNYVVVLAKIDSVYILLDATEPLCNFRELPTRCFNDVGFVIQKKKVEWIQFNSDFVSEVNYNFDIKPVLEKDSIVNNCKLITTGYDDIDYRTRFAEGYDKVKENLIDLNSQLIDSIRSINLTDIEKPFEIDFKEMMPLESLENKLIISPFCYKAISENPFKMPERKYPIDMVYRKSKSFNSTIVIPNGYKLYIKPTNMEIDNNMIHIKYLIDITQKESVKIAGSYEFKKSVYPTSDYADLKMYYNKIIHKFNEKVVLIKE